MIDHENIIGLADKVALITDIESATGYVIAEALVKSGAQVHCVSPQHDICAQRVKQLRRWGRASGHVVDLRNGIAALQFAYQLNEELPRLHILVSNCRIAPSSSTSNRLGRATAGQMEILGELALIHELLGSLRDAATTSDPARAFLIATSFSKGEQSVNDTQQARGLQRFKAHAGDVAIRLKEHRVNFNFFELKTSQESSAIGASVRPRAASALLTYLTSEAARRTGEVVEVRP